jgi:hypothetical protein
MEGKFKETVMSSETIGASVGMHKNGATNCYNQPNDVATVVKLLNSISAAEGGTKDANLPPSAGPSQLYQAIRNFQQKQNALGRLPLLSVDGHVDPNDKTLARLNSLRGGTSDDATKRIVHSIAAMSWIDQRLYDPEDLPEVDHYSKAPDYMTRSALVANHGYRFVNFLEAYIEVNGQQQIVDKDFTNDSRMYNGPSFRGIPPTTFPVKTSSAVSDDGQSVTFMQTVGCKTHSPEEIGAREAVRQVGGVLGIPRGWEGAYGTGPLFSRAAEAGWKVAENFRVFPPIWTVLELTISVDATFEANLVSHSLFPSNTFYRQKYSVELLTTNTQSYEQVRSFDARANIDLWRKTGWGPKPVYSTGPSGGNPWNIPDPRVLGTDLPFRPGIPHE